MLASLCHMTSACKRAAFALRIWAMRRYVGGYWQQRESGKLAGDPFFDNQL